MTGKTFVFFTEEETNGDESIKRLRRGAHFIKEEKTESIFYRRPEIVYAGKGNLAQKSFKTIKEIIEIPEMKISSALNPTTDPVLLKKEIFKLWGKPKMRPYNVFLAILSKEVLREFLKTFKEFTEPIEIQPGSLYIIESQWEKDRKITIIT